MTVMYDLVKSKDKKIEVSEKSWKLKFVYKIMQNEPIAVEVDEEEKKEMGEETKEEAVKEFVPYELASAHIAVELHE